MSREKLNALASKSVVGVRFQLNPQHLGPTSLSLRCLQHPFNIFMRQPQRLQRLHNLFAPARAA